MNAGGGNMSSLNILLDFDHVASRSERHVSGPY